MLRPMLALALLVVGLPPARADVRVVGPTGAPYAEIQTAVDAANDGDVVLVRSGTYASFVIRNKELAVVADANATVLVDGAIRVSGLAATRSVLLEGLKATGTFGSQASARHGLFARNCDGPLRIVGCELTGLPLNLGTGQCYEGQGAYVDHCADVAFVGCLLKGSNAPERAGYPSGVIPDASEADGGHGLFTESSTTALYDDDLRGGRAGAGEDFGTGYADIVCEPLPHQSTPGYVGAGGEGYRGQNSFVFASNCTFVGALGWSSGCFGVNFCTCAGSGGNGFVHGGAANNALLLASTATGGVGGTTTNYCPGLTVWECRTHECSGQTVAPSGAAVVGSVSILQGGAKRISTQGLAREGQAVTLTYSGQAGDRVELLVGERPGFQYLVGARGVVLVQRTRPQLVMQVGMLGANGTLTQTFTVGELGPGVQSRTTWLQAVMINGANQSTLSSPAAVVLLDAAF